MTTELEAFAGHLLVVGGRAVSMPPPGALAEATPKKTSRAREGDRFFVLMTPADGTHASAAFYEEIARLAAGTYFGSSGGVTGGLREALIAVNERMRAYEAQTGQPQRLNAIAAALRGPELYTARSGRVFGALWQEGRLTFFPGDRHDPLAMAVPPLGASESPDIDLSHTIVGANQSLLLADVGLLDADDDVLREALACREVRAGLDQLKTCAGVQTSATLVRLVTPGTPNPDRMTAPAASRPKPTAPVGSAGDRFARPIGSPPAESGSSGPSINIDTAALSAAVADRARTALDRASETAAKVADASREHAPTVIETATVTGRRTLRGSLRGVLTGLLAITHGVQHAFETLLPGPDEEGKQRIPTNLAISMAILIPVVIVVVVVGLFLSERGRTDFMAYLNRAEDAHQAALAASGGTCNDKTLRPQWQEVLALADEAAKFRQDDLTLLQIQADAQNYLDCFDDVQRHNVTLLREFPDGADLRGPIVHLGVDIYTLDRAHGAIYHDTLDDGGASLIGVEEAPVLRTGSAVGSFVVGDVFDIEWLRSGGTVHDNVLIGLDTDGILYTYSPAWGSTSQSLVTENRWQDPVAISVFEENIYVMDTGANQIWKYVPSMGDRRYNLAPEEYFTGASLPDLSSAVDFGISADEGAVYILYRDGVIRKYQRSAQDDVEQRAFDYNQKPEGAIAGGSALFIDNDPAARYLYITDPVQQTIYQTSWGGRFESGYRPRNNPTAFQAASGVFSDAITNNSLYIVAGNRLYHMYAVEPVAEATQ
ncbi:hypothetical protein [Aggregatilinea lenta]|uniref:hypothetical protein n=1 Tax=Aggregatilinea lenta TaxID=913108 RepID=UPI000E5AF609|nr:hypothetical protein [Aggregatilinea lenta]